MDLDGFFHDAEIGGGLLVQLTGDDMGENFTFARGERVKAGLDVLQFGAGEPRDAVLLNGDLNRLEQIAVIHRLGEEIQCSAFHCLHTCGDVAVAGQENNRDGAAFHRQSRLQLQAIQAGHREIEHETTGGAGVVAFQKFLRRAERHHVEPRRAQQAREALQHCGIVVHDENGWRWCHH